MNTNTCHYVNFNVKVNCLEGIMSSYYSLLNNDFIILLDYYNSVLKQGMNSKIHLYCHCIQ